VNIFRSIEELNATPGKWCMAIGFFDGVHLGHQQVIGQTLADARQHEAAALIVTFDRHPNAVVAPDRVPPLIYRLPQKVRAIESLGADSLLLIHFDETFSRQTAEAFVRSLAPGRRRVQSVSVGADFVFGYKRGGDVRLLRQLGQELGFGVHAIAAVSLDGKAVSSTRIREAIASGDLDLAGQMLGRAYSIYGTVVRGDQVGKSLGFPTANLDVTGLILPPRGVYAAHARLGNQQHRAVVNIGIRPTLRDASPQVRVEAHLLDFQSVVYEQELELTFVAKLRDEQRFDSLDALKAQIGKDVETARTMF
jgi:riboflavin kinase / FMN adenylyltransferase